MSDTEYNETIGKRIKKLMALSESPNQNEAEAAAAKARALLKQYNMEMADLSEVGDQNIDHWVADATGSMASWQGSLASTIASAFFCKVLIRTTAAGNNIVSVYGRKSNLETVKVMYDYLCDAVERMVRENMKGHRKKAKDDYRYGIVAGLRAKLAEQQAKDTSSETALVKTMDKEVNDYVSKMATGTVNHGRRRVSSHYYNGVSDGRNISLNKQVRGN